MTIAQKQYTVAEFEAFVAEHPDRLLELINGEIVEKVVTLKHGEIALNIGAAIKIFLKQNPIGRVGTEVAHHAPDDPHNQRIPDLSFIAGMDRPGPDKGAFPGMPDLAVEVKSPNDTYREMQAKATYYLSKGARMVWLVYPEKLLVEALTPTDRQLLSGDEKVTGGDVLPGFSLAVNDIFAGV